MATWKSENSILTQQGTEIVNRIKAGFGKITITKVVAGSGRVAESQLYVQTSVSGIQKELTISYLDTYENGVQLSFYIDNKDFAESYDLHQIGVYVTHPDYTGEVLYHISQCEANNFDSIPSVSDNPLIQGYSIFMEHLNSSSIELVVDPQGMVKREELDKELEKVNNAITNAITSVPIGLKESVNYYIDSAGNDRTGDGSINAPFATIQKAVDLIPYGLNGYDVNIYVGNGEYAGFIMSNKYNGRINITKNSSLGSDVFPIIKGTSTIEYCGGCHISVNSLKINAIYGQIGALIVRNTPELFINKCEFDGLTVGAGIQVMSGGTNCIISECIFKNCNPCVQTNRDISSGGFCTVSMFKCTGSSNVTGCTNNFAVIGLNETDETTLGCNTLFKGSLASGPNFLDGVLYSPISFTVLEAQLIDE